MLSPSNDTYEPLTEEACVLAIMRARAFCDANGHAIAAIRLSEAIEEIEKVNLLLTCKLPS